jgi:hypothetical protein
LFVDYDPKTEQSVRMFETIQNKMHWASHGEIAVETVYKRVILNSKRCFSTLAS